MIMGSNFLTIENFSLFNLIKKIKYFKTTKEVLNKYEKGEITLHSFIWIKLRISKKISKIKKNINIRQI